MGFSFFRTIWITLRASNYTTRAFEDTIRGLKKMQRDQLRFRMNAAKNMFAVGTMYLAFGTIAVGVLGAVMNSSRLGQRVMENFGKRVGKSMAKLGDALASILAPILEITANILEMAMTIPFFKELVAIVLILGTAFLLAKGVTMMFSSALTMLHISQVASTITTKVQAQTLLTKFVPATKASTVATYSLGQSLMFVAAGFTAAFGAVFMVYQIFGKMPAIILGVVIALVALLVVVLALANVLTLGGATMLAVAGAGVGGAIGAMAVASMPEHQMGTSFVRQGGLARVHAGEEIISAREKQVQPRWEKREFKKSFWDVNVSIGDVHTKADEETMIPMIKRALKESLDNK